MTLKLAVLISGRGSNLMAVQHAIATGNCRATIALVVSDRASAAGLAFATERGIPTAIVSIKEYPDRASWDHALTERVAACEPDVVVTAGFMKLVSPAFLARFGGRVINIHPALLPLFPGTHAVEQALAAGVRLSGCTVHLVDSGVDSGPIIAQTAVAVLPGDDAEQLHARIQRAEHQLLPSVLDAVARGVIAISPKLHVQRLADELGQLSSPPLRAGNS
jgi:phosphoribosylglycinamide formyltransferase-1